MLLKALHLQPLTDLRILRQLMAVLDKLKGESDDDVNTKYLQVFQHICNNETLALADTEAIKKLTECFYLQLSKKSPVIRKITSALMLQTYQIIFSLFNAQMDALYSFEEEQLIEESGSPEVPLGE